MSSHQQVNIEKIWYRNVQLGEFYNIERVPKIAGGGGSLYIEIPNSLVQRTLEFLNADGEDVSSLPVITIDAGVIGSPSQHAPIEFHPKRGNRMRIARQNRQQASSLRHPAWSPDNGFPKAPDGVTSKAEAEAYFPDGGIRIYIAKSYDGQFFAGYTTGYRPPTMKPEHPMWELYCQTGVGGVINA